MKAITLNLSDTLKDAFYGFDRTIDSLWGGPAFSPTVKVFGRIPAVDIRETGKAYVLEMELPGFREQDIDIRLEEGHLSIASRKAEETAGGEAPAEGNWILRERRCGEFRRFFKLPRSADGETVDAEFRNGILRLEIGKKVEAQPRVIPINAKGNAD